MAATDRIAVTMTRAQWARIYRTIMRADDPTPTSFALANRIAVTLQLSAAEQAEVIGDISS